MGYADFECPDHDADNVTVVYDTEIKRVKLFRSYMDDEDSSQDEWVVPSETDHFYPTKEDAEKALDDYRKELFDKMDEMKEYIRIMYEWKTEKGERFYHDLEDYMPLRLTYYIKNDTWAEEERKEAKKRLKYLMDYVQTGYMNIGARTFRKEDVSYVEWGSKKAELHFRNLACAATTTIDDVERWFVELIFGCNRGGKVYPDIDNS